MTDAKRAAIEQYAKALFDEHIDAEVEKIVAAIRAGTFAYAGRRVSFGDLFDDWVCEFCFDSEKAEREIDAALRRAVREALTT
jgi:hypothetical protein